MRTLTSTRCIAVGSNIFKVTTEIEKAQNLPSVLQASEKSVCKSTERLSRRYTLAVFSPVSGAWFQLSKVEEHCMGAGRLLRFYSYAPWAIRWYVQQYYGVRSKCPEMQHSGEHCMGAVRLLRLFAPREIPWRLRTAL